ncbi:hypothetical protein [Halorientalis salina]|uniref:hypothetical protein n=1 Tax=Halorientalis salina TaxID=2932266 RepID=UPI0010AC184A|nr:hypothetical protein [Halorientalis salina]
MTIDESGPLGGSRRSFLQTAATGIFGSSLLGSAAATGIEDQYRTVVDVTDAGADNTGTQSVSSDVQSLIGDDTLLKFPSGRYVMDEQVRLTGFENVGLVGADATLVPADYDEFDGPQYRLFRLGVSYSPGKDIRVENFTVDQRGANTGIRAFEITASDGLLVRDVTIVGRHDSGTWGPALFRITDSGGSGRVERFRAADGGAWETETPGSLWRGPTGILAAQIEGTLRFNDCVIDDFPDNGLYATGSGTVEVTGGAFHNSGTVNVRMDTDSGHITGSEFVVDDPSWYHRAQVPIRFQDGSWFDVQNVSIELTQPNGDAIQFKSGAGGGAISDSTIEIRNEPATGVLVDPSAGPTYLDGVDIDIDASANAIRIEGDDDGEVIVQDGRISGGASGQVLRHAIRCERDHCEFRGITMDQWGGSERSGLALTGRDYMVYQCEFRTTDRPLTIAGDDVWVEDCYCNSYSAQESVLLGSTANSIRLKNNGFPDGIEDNGASEVLATGTSY